MTSSESVMTPFVCKPEGHVDGSSFKMSSTIPTTTMKTTTTTTMTMRDEREERGLEDVIENCRRRNNVDYNAALGKVLKAE